MHDTANKTALQSRQWFQYSLLELMRVKPYTEISIKEISRLAGLDRKTYYRHFKSKDDILRLHCEII